MNKRKILAVLVATVTFAHCSLAHSDQISLKNGDTIQGSLISKTEAFVVWESNNFGTLRIPLDQILPSHELAKPSAVISSDNKKPPFKGSIGLSGSYLGGNEERDDLELDIGFSFEDGDAIHEATLNYESLGQGNESTINDYAIAYGIDWSISYSWYWGNNFSYGADDKRQINRSISAGTNMGYQFWKNEQGKLSTEIGLTWINDKLFSAIVDERLTWAWSGDYEKLLIKKIFLAYSHQLNVSVKDSDNTQMVAEIGIIIPVTDKLDTRISWDWSFDNQPEEGNETIDRKIKFGINYTL
jgi:putative salt-induced outer membrane protein YdiY